MGAVPSRADEPLARLESYSVGCARRASMLTSDQRERCTDGVVLMSGRRNRNWNFCCRPAKSAGPVSCLLFPNHSRPKAVNGYDFPRKAKHDSDYNSEYEHDYEHDYDYE